MLKHIDLFAGIGGFSLAFESVGFQSVAFSEIDSESALVYEYHFPHSEQLGDIKQISGAEVLRRYGPIDVLTGGVPCQPASALGLMRGTADERWLWPEAIRLVGEIRPRFAVFENPPALLTLDGGRAWNGIAGELVALGYDLWWDVFPAAAFGAGHLRERVILIAIRSEDASDTTGFSSRGETNSTNTIIANANGCGRATERPRRLDGDHERATEQTYELAYSDSHSAGFQGHSGDEIRNGQQASRRPIAAPDLRERVNADNWWHEAVTGIPVLVDGLPNRLVEAVSRCTGNSVVPQVIQPIAEAIKAL